MESTKRAIGKALSSIIDDVIQEVVDLVSQYRDVKWEDRIRVRIIKSAVDSPARLRARLQGWIGRYDAKHGSGSGVDFLNECLVASGSNETIATLSSQLSSLEDQALTIVEQVSNGWTWDQVADAIESQHASTDEEFRYQRLEVPQDYITVWGERWYKNVQTR